MFTSLVVNGQTKESLNLLSIYGHHSFALEMLKHVLLCCYCFLFCFLCGVIYIIMHLHLVVSFVNCWWIIFNQQNLSSNLTMNGFSSALVGENTQMAHKVGGQLNLVTGKPLAKSVM